MLSRRRNHLPIRVMIVDYTRMTCQLLADAISQDENIEVISAVTSLQEAAQGVRHMSPDVVLLSANIGGQPTGGFELSRQLRMIKQELLVVTLLDRLDSASVVEAFRAQARGVFIRDGSVQSLVKCIHSVVRGQVWASAEVLRCVLEALADTSTPTFDPGGIALLTKREREVVSLAVDGATKGEIARKLCLSEHTIKNYLFSIFGKLGVSSRLELTLAFKRGSVQNANVVSITHDSVARNDERLAWLHSLADQGLASAQLLLAQLYSEGLGVPHNRTQAYRLYMLAESSAELGEISQAARKKLAGKMTPREISEAERAAVASPEENRRQPLKAVQGDLYPSLNNMHRKPN